jgi:hypothetical protein
LKVRLKCMLCFKEGVEIKNKIIDKYIHAKIMNKYYQQHNSKDYISSSDLRSWIYSKICKSSKNILMCFGRFSQLITFSASAVASGWFVVVGSATF